MKRHSSGGRDGRSQEHRELLEQPSGRQDLLWAGCVMQSLLLWHSSENNIVPLMFIHIYEQLSITFNLLFLNDNLNSTSS